MPKIESPIFKVLPVFLKDLSKCIEPGDIDRLAANLVVGYLKDGFPDANNPFELTCRHWIHVVNIHPLPGLKPGKPCYAVIAGMWHSASFHPFYVLFGFARTKTAARQIFPMSLSYEGYPYSQEKPEITEISGGGLMIL